MFFVSMMLILRLGSTFPVSNKLAYGRSCQLSLYFLTIRPLRGFLKTKSHAKSHVFFMRLGRGSFSQSIDYLLVREKLACQLVQKTHAWHPIVQKPHAWYTLVQKPHACHCLRNSCKNILQIWINIVPLQDRCGEICLLATTLKNAKMLTNGDRVARKPLFISMFCVFVTSPHQWDVFLFRVAKHCN